MPTNDHVARLRALAAERSGLQKKSQERNGLQSPDEYRRELEARMRSGGTGSKDDHKASDYAKLVGSGAAGVVGAVTSLADLATGGAVNRKSEELLGRRATDITNDASEKYLGQLSPAMKASMQKRFISDKEGETFGNAWTDPHSIAGTIVQSSPSFVVGGGVAGAGAKIGAGLAGRGAGTAAAKAAAKKKGAKVGATVGGAVGEGGIEAGFASDELDREMRHATPDEWLKSPRYQQYTAAGLSPEEAKEATIQDARKMAAMKVGSISAVAGGVFGKYLGDLITKSGGGRVAEAGKMALVEGATEFVQEGSAAHNVEQTLSSEFGREYNTRDVLNQAVAGTVAGGVQGGALGLAMGGGSISKAANAGLTAPPSARPNTPPNTPPPAGAAPGAAPAGMPAGFDQLTPENQERLQSVVEQFRASPDYDPAREATGVQRTIERFLAEQRAAQVAPIEEELADAEAEQLNIEEGSNAEAAAAEEEKAAKAAEQEAKKVEQEAKKAEAEKAKTEDKQYNDELAAAEKALEIAQKEGEANGDRVPSPALIEAKKKRDKIVADRQAQLEGRKVKPEDKKPDTPAAPVAETPAPTPAPAPKAEDISEDTNTTPDTNNAPVSVETPEPRKGKKEKVFTPANTEVEVQYELAEVDDLVTSHDFDGNENEAFPGRLQLRDRTREGSRQHLEGIAKEFKPERVGSNPLTSDGAPIVGMDNLVESGNGRINVLRERIYGGQKEREYREWLKANAEQFGLSAAEIDNMEAPVLVRRRIQDMTPEERAKFTDESNQRTSQDISDYELAVNDSEKITPELLAKYKPTVKGDVLADQNQQFVQNYLAEVMTGDNTRYQDAEGKQNELLATRIKNAVFHHVYGSKEMTELGIEHAAGSMKGVVNALHRAAPAMAKLKSADRKFDAADLNELVLGAVRVLKDAQTRGIKVDELVRQLDMLSSPFSQAELQLGLWLDQNSRSEVRMADAFVALADTIREDVIRRQTPDMLGGETPPITLEAALLRASEILTEKHGDGKGLESGDLFNQIKQEQAGSKQSDDGETAGSDDAGGKQAEEPRAEADEQSNQEAEESSEEEAEETSGLVDEVKQTVKEGKNKEGKKATAPEHINNDGRPRNPDRKYGAVEPGSSKEPIPLEDESLFGEDALRLGITKEMFENITDSWLAIFDVEGKPRNMISEGKNTPYISQEEADKIRREWYDAVDNRQIKEGELRGRPNYERTVISLFDLSGAWAQPWVEAGYNVIQIDIQDGLDVHELDRDWFIENYDIDDVHAIIAACPCTDFTNAASRFWKDKDADGRTETAKDLVFRTMALIDYWKPALWAIENPMATRLHKETGLPPARLHFNPSNFGDPVTKPTSLWGNFNTDLPMANVEPEGSKTDKHGGKSLETKNARSVTPEGFSYAFFMANDYQRLPVVERYTRYYPLAEDAIRTAFDAGVSEQEIADILNDSYDYQDGVAGGSREELAKATIEAKKAQATEADTPKEDIRNVPLSELVPNDGDKLVVGYAPDLPEHMREDVAQWTLNGKPQSKPVDLSAPVTLVNDNGDYTLQHRARESNVNGLLKIHDSYVGASPDAATIAELIEKAHIIELGDVTWNAKPEKKKPEPEAPVAPASPNMLFATLDQEGLTIPGITERRGSEWVNKHKIKKTTKYLSFHFVKAKNKNATGKVATFLPTKNERTSLEQATRELGGQIATLKSIKKQLEKYLKTPVKVDEQTGMSMEPENSPHAQRLRKAIEQLQEAIDVNAVRMHTLTPTVRENAEQHSDKPLHHRIKPASADSDPRVKEWVNVLNQEVEGDTAAHGNYVALPKEAKTYTHRAVIVMWDEHDNGKPELAVEIETGYGSDARRMFRDPHEAAKWLNDRIAKNSSKTVDNNKGRELVEGLLVKHSAGLDPNDFLTAKDAATAYREEFAQLANDQDATVKDGMIQNAVDPIPTLVQFAEIRQFIAENPDAKDADIAKAGKVTVEKATRLRNAIKGAQPAKPKAYGSENKLVTQDRYEELKAKFKKKTSGGTLNSGVDPELFGMAIEMAVYHLEAGVRSFKDFAKAMVADLGEDVRPLLKTAYNGARDYPGVEFSEEMDAYELVSKTDVKSIDAAKPDQSGSIQPEADGDAVKIVGWDEVGESIESGMVAYLPDGTPVFVDSYAFQNKQIVGVEVRPISGGNASATDPQEVAPESLRFAPELMPEGMVRDPYDEAEMVVDGEWVAVEWNQDTKAWEDASGNEYSTEIESVENAPSNGQTGAKENKNAPSSIEGLEQDRDDITAPDGVGETSVSEESGSDGSRAGELGDQAGTGRESEQSDPGVSDGTAAASGATSDQQVYSEDGQLGSEGSTAGSPESSGSPESDAAGIQPDGRADDETAANVAESRERQKSLEQRKVAQREAESTEVVIADQGNIEATLPVLLPSQQDDILKAERRLLEQNKKGMLFTNATGTGKTYTGLGVIKRFVKRGKGNILIVVPGEKKVADWIEDGENLLLDITALENTKDGAPGIRVTTYANMRANKALGQVDWDLIVYDESHRLMQSKDSSATTRAHRYLTNHRTTVEERIKDQSPEWQEVLRKENEAFLEASKQAKKGIPNWHDLSKNHQKSLTRPIVENILGNEWQDQKAALEKRLKEQAPAKREQTKVMFLSATPFAYRESLQYAEGYLFDNPKVEEGSRVSGHDQFYVENFGYRIRSNRLTEPDAEANVGLLERMFHEKLKAEGALSGRVLDVDADYRRQFVEMEHPLATKIAEALEFVLDFHNDSMDALRDDLTLNFSELTRLMEYLKADEAVARAKEHLKLGRKVVVFHQYVSNDPVINPFAFTIPTDADIAKERALYPEDHDEVLPLEARRTAILEFQKQFPELAKAEFTGFEVTPDRFMREFGADKVGVYNGKAKKTRMEDITAFNKDGSGKDIIIVQMEAGKEGISLHDVTGKHQRVFMSVSLPLRPTDAMQSEGRIYRTGQMSNAIMEYLKLGLNFERRIFSRTAAGRAGTVENLAMGDEARALQRAFMEQYQDSTAERPSVSQGQGGKAGDRGSNSATDFEKARAVYHTNLKKTAKTKSAEGVDYFPTPEPLGVKMVEWANVKTGERMLEPSAGHGAIARWFPEHTRNTFIEESIRLYDNLIMNASHGGSRNIRFEELHINNKFDAVVMNPPWGKGGNTAAEHVQKAMIHTRNGGRIVALVPNGGMAGRRMNKLLTENPSFHLVADMVLPPSVFERAGTNAVGRVMVLEKHTEKGFVAPAPMVTEVEADNIEQFFDAVQNLPLPERTEVAEELKEKIANDNLDEDGNVIITDDEHDDTPRNNSRGKGRKPKKPKPPLAFEVEAINVLGKPMHGVKPNQFIQRPQWQEYNKQAKELGGKYDPGSRTWAFANQTTAQQFAANIAPKFSRPAARMATPIAKEGSYRVIAGGEQANKLSALAERIKAAWGQTVSMLPVRLLPNRGNREARRVQRAIKQLFGRDVVFFHSQDPLAPNGAFVPSQPNTLFINVNSDRPMNQVMGHELLHSIRKADEALYAEIVEALEGYLQNYPDYAQELLANYSNDGLSQPSNALVSEEYIADTFAALFAEPGFLSELQGVMEPSFFRKLVDMALAFFDKLVAKLKGHESDAFAKRYISDIEAARQVVLGALRVHATELSVEGYTHPDANRVLQSVEAMFSRGKTRVPFMDQVYPAEKKMLQRFLRIHPDGKSIRAELKKHAGTPWEKQAILGIITQQSITDIMRGKEVVPSDQNPLFAPRSAKMLAAVRRGEPGIIDYFKYESGSGLISHPDKAENSVNSSFMNCKPSRDCATFCYAVNGNALFHANIARTELTDYLVQHYPKIAAGIAAEQYSMTEEYRNKKALRLFEKGDLSPQYLKFIEELNKITPDEKIGAIRVQVFSKNPELLRQVPEMNVRMLSIDASNTEMAEANPDLDIALVFDGSDELVDLAHRHKDHIAVVLPIKAQGKDFLAKERLADLPPELRPHVCPVDAGKVRLKGQVKAALKEAAARGASEAEIARIRKSEWNCTKCDKNVGLGCFHNSVTEKVMKALSIPLDQTPPEKISEAERAIRSKVREFVRLGIIGAANEEIVYQELAGLIPQNAQRKDAGGKGGVVQQSGQDAQSASGLIGLKNLQDDDTPLFMRRTAPLDFPSRWTLPDETRWQAVVRNMQNQFARIKTIQKSITDAGGVITEEQDVELAERNYMGSAANEVRGIQQDFVRPIVEMLEEANLTLEEFDAYLYAKHAEERNNHVWEINPEFRDFGIPGSGMSNAEADMILSEFDADQTAALERAAGRVYSMNEFRLDTMIEHGLEDDENIGTWRDRYDYYVPLKGQWDGKKIQRIQAGRGYESGGRNLIAAFGRRSRADSPFANAVLQAQEAAIRGQKAKVGQALYNLMGAHQNSNAFEFYDHRSKLKAVWDATKGEVVYKPDTKLPDDVVKVKVDGKIKYIRLVDPLLHRAFLRLHTDEISPIERMLLKVNRYLSTINTSLNPEFIVSNLARDFQTALHAMAAETDIGQLQGMSIGKMTADMTKSLPGAIRGIHSLLRKEEAGTSTHGASDWEKMFYRYREAGAMTGFFDMRDIDGLKAEIEGLIAEAAGGKTAKARKAYRKAKAAISNLNSAVENGARLAAFKMAVENGMSDKAAAGLARNLTVNFNRRGELGTAMNAMYLFYNAGIQGSAQMVKVMQSPLIQKIAGATVVFAFGLAMLNRAMAGDDDDGENYYDRMPNSILERNMVIMLGGEDKYLAIPLPYGYNIFHVLGTQMARMMQGKPVLDSSMAIIRAAATSFLPVASDSSDDPTTFLMKMVSPTITDPFLELAVNENSFNAPITKPKYPGSGNQIPDAHLSMRNTSEAAKAFTQALNDWTGGTPVSSGAIDISPDAIEHIVEFATGGVGKFATRTLSTTGNLVTGNTDDIELKDIPFLRRVYGETPDWTATQRYYESVKKVDEAGDVLKFYGGDRSKLSESQRELLPLKGRLRTVQSRLQILYKRRKQAIGSKYLTESQREEKIEKINEEIGRLQKQFGKKYEDAI